MSSGINKALFLKVNAGIPSVYMHSHSHTVCVLTVSASWLVDGLVPGLLLTHIDGETRLNAPETCGQRDVFCWPSCPSSLWVLLSPIISLLLKRKRCVGRGVF